MSSVAQKLYEVSELPEGGLAASAAFFADHLGHARALIGSESDDSLAVVLPPAGTDHDDWRLSLARDLARAHAPRRVNLIAGPEGRERAAILDYLASAAGVTGQYLSAHG